MALDALRVMGHDKYENITILPCATGVTCMMCLLSMRNTEGNRGKSVVLWCRIDQVRIDATYFSKRCTPSPTNGIMLTCHHTPFLRGIASLIAEIVP